MTNFVVLHLSKKNIKKYKSMKLLKSLRKMQILRRDFRIFLDMQVSFKRFLSFYKQIKLVNYTANDLTRFSNANVSVRVKHRTTLILSPVNRSSNQAVTASLDLCLPLNVYETWRAISVHTVLRSYFTFTKVCYQKIE